MGGCAVNTFLGMPGPARATERGTLRGVETFPQAARKALANGQLRRNLVANKREFP